MLAKSVGEFIDFFREIDDLRQDEKILYPLHEILFLVFTGVLSGAESWRELEDFGNQKLEVLRKYFSYIHGIPSRASISRIFSLIKKENIELWLENNALKLVKNLIKGEQLAIDGKSLRGKQKMEANSQGSHVLNVLATKAGMLLSQRTVGSKGNELEAMHEIIEHSDLRDTVVSIDAAGCQKTITDKVREKSGHYFLALKGNHPKLYNDVVDLFNNTETTEVFETNDIGHGRTEKRICKALDVTLDLQNKYPAWRDLASVCMIESHRIIKDKASIECRYYLSSEPADAEKQLNYARNHWKIESMHWILDVVFKEDNSLLRKNNAAENMSAIRKMVLNLIKQHKNRTGSKKGITVFRKSAGWNDKVLIELIDSWVYGCS